MGVWGSGGFLDLGAVGMGFTGSQAWVCYGIGGFWGSRGFGVVLIWKQDLGMVRKMETTIWDI